MDRNITTNAVFYDTVNSRIVIRIIMNKRNYYKVNNIIHNYNTDINSYNLSTSIEINTDDIINEYDNKKINFDNIIDNFDNYYLQYLNSNGTEIGNYIFKIEINQQKLLDDYNFKLINNINQEYKVNYLGKYTNYIYLSLINKPVENYTYTLISDNNDIYISLVFNDFEFVSNTYSYGKILYKDVIFYGTINKDMNIITELDTINIYIMPVVQDITISLDNNSFNVPSYINNNRIVTYSTVTEIIEHTPQWKNDFIFRLFNKISLFFNDFEIDTLNRHTYKIETQLKMNSFTKQQFLQVTKPELINGKLVFYLPLLFYFSKFSDKYLPIIAMEYVDIFIKCYLNDFTELFDNYIYNSDLPNTIKIKLLTDTILLEDKEREIFGSYRHEYLIKRNKLRNEHFINTINKNIQLDINGLVNSIYWICETTNTKKSYYLYNYKNDDYYDLFIDYKTQYDNGTTDDDINYLFENINNDIENASDNYILITQDNYLKDYDIEFLLFIYYKYLDVDVTEQVKINRLQLYI